MIPQSRIKGIVFMVLAMGSFIASDSASKFVLSEIPPFEVVMLRAIAAMVFCLVVVVVMGHGRELPRMINPWALARGVCEVGANLTFTFAIMRLPIGDVTAICQTAPLLVFLGASFFFGERVGALRLLLISVGVSGALLVAQPGSTAFSPYALLGFVVAISAAIRDLITRKVPKGTPAPIAALAVLAMLTLAGEIGMITTETPVMPTLTQGLLLVLAGALMVGGHVGLYIAFTSAPVRTVAPFMYALTIWAVLSSVVLFGEMPNTLAIGGMALIILAGVAVIFVDAQQTRTERRARAAAAV
ncbi:DMT family transporter [Aestuariivirga sp.]|uniref:DMT family transporter n=1 Tax=Aestuariivirga sp. TaxID=2650926 RepID=UPI0039E38460